MKIRFAPVSYTLVILTVILLTAGLGQAGSFWVDHVTAYDGWRTLISIYNPGNDTVPVILYRYTADGTQYGSPVALNAEPMKWFNVNPNTVLDYEGTAYFGNDTNELIAKVSYQYQSSQSVCEFLLSEDNSYNNHKEWYIPNTYHSWMGYSGLAVVNGNAGSITLILEAWKGGVKVGTVTKSLGKADKYISLSDSIWSGVGYKDFDTFIVRSSQEIPPPMAIAGNAAGDRHLFYLGQALDYSLKAMVEAGQEPWAFADAN